MLRRIILSLALLLSFCSVKAQLVDPGNIPLSINLNSTTEACNGSGGSIDISISGWSKPATYSYIWSNGATTQDLTNIGAGTYSVTVSGSCRQCALISRTGYASYTIGDNAPIASVSTTSAGCGLNGGSISLTISNFNDLTAPVTVSRTLGNQVVSQEQTVQSYTYSQLGEGNYSIEVTDGMGCSTILNAVVTGAFTVNSTATYAGCGYIDIDVANPTGGIGPYSYAWSTGAQTQDIVNVSEGMYWVTITDQGTGCALVHHQNLTSPALTVNSVTADYDCPTGNLDVNISGGVGPYSYELLNSSLGIGNSSNTDYTFTGVMNSTGLGHIVKVTDSRGCVAYSQPLPYNTEDQLAITGNVMAHASGCAGTANGQIDITDPVGPGVTYSWSNGMAGSKINVPAGTYTVTVQENGGCYGVATYTVDDYYFRINHSRVNDYCGQGGSINLGVEHGTAPYTYTWSNGAITRDLIGLIAGTYSVTATDANGCTASIGPIIIATDSSLDVLAWARHPPTVCGGTDGYGYFEVKGGSGSYSWVCNNVIPSTGTTGNSLSINNFTAGYFYAITITDNTNPSCQGALNFFIPEGPIGVAISTIDAGCDSNSGQAEVVISPDATATSYTMRLYKLVAGAMTLQWIQTTSLLTHNFDLGEGIYQLIVDPVNGDCGQFTENFQIQKVNSSPTITSIQTTDENCTSLGTATLSPSTHAYSWSNGAEGHYQDNLPAGRYQVTVRNQSGCTSVEEIVVGGASAPYLEAGDINCPIGSNNDVEVGIWGGVGIYDVSWSGPSTGSIIGLNAHSFDIPNAVAGTYTITITDANNCSSIETLVVGDNFNNTSLGIDFEELNCISLEASASITGHPYAISSYSWLVGSNVQGEVDGTGIFRPYQGNQIPVGGNTNYTLVVEDASGCKAEVSATSPIINELSIDITVGSATCDPDVNISGGTAPYTVVWRRDYVIGGIVTGTEVVQATETSSNLYTENNIPDGNYSIELIDANGCRSNATYVVEVAGPSVKDLDLYIRWKRPEEEACVGCVDASPATVEQAEAKVIAENLSAQAQQLVDQFEEDLLCSFNGYTENTTSDEVIIGRQLKHHHYTLYYHNLRGELVRTVPPSGVQYLNESQVLALKADRKDGSATATAVMPNHSLVTEYNQNALGGMTTSNTPDKGETRMAYAADGRMRFSQDAKQLADGTYSYIHYDEFERAVESGEANFDLAGSGPDNWEQLLELVYLSDNSYPSDPSLKDEWVHTYYDEEHEVNSIPITYCGTTETQTYLRNRVSYSETHQGVTTSYSYDPHGNVIWTRQYIPGLGDNYVKMDYDLISGKTLQVVYNECAIDRFYHKYAYDEENRLIQVMTSEDGLLWEEEANYEYYAYGPLKRTEIGEDDIQGLDYSYTLQGWIKAVNHPYLDNYNASGFTNTDNDPGQDGIAGGNPSFGRDAFGYSLGYFDGDYTRNNSIKDAITYSTNKQLYNGNISEWSQGINTGYLQTGGTAGWTGNELLTQRSFDYDDLNRIRQSVLLQTAQTSGIPSLANSNDAFKTQYSYDGNGNLLNLERKAAGGGTIDDLSYQYNNVNTNQLTAVVDAQGVNTVGDFEYTQNYIYDEIGNLVQSLQGNGMGGTAETLDVEWNVQGKVDQVNVSGATNSQLQYLYDASGNRVVKLHLTDPMDPLTAVYTYHVRDASGNILATYERSYNGTADEITLRERGLYGSSRLGISRPNEEIASSLTNYGTLTPLSDPSISSRLVPLNSNAVYGRSLLERSFELTDHLGNVATLLSDRKQFDGTSDYTPSILQYRNYYPFGYEMQQRGGAMASSEDYRFGFNGKENDEDWGGQMIQDYGFRLYNPAIGKFLSVDPLAPSYPWYTPYQFAGNKPIIAIDLDGLEEDVKVKVDVKEQTKTELKIETRSTVDTKVSKTTTTTTTAKAKSGTSAKPAARWIIWELAVVGITISSGGGGRSSQDLANEYNNGNHGEFWNEWQHYGYPLPPSSPKAFADWKARFWRDDVELKLPDDRKLDDDKNDVFVYRFDGKEMIDYFSEGFDARGSNEDLWAHVTGKSGSPRSGGDGSSAFISTSKSLEFVMGGSWLPNPLELTGYIYLIRDDPENFGRDVNLEFGNASPFPEEEEVAIPYGIDPSDIRGRFHIKNGQMTGKYEANPNFKE